MKKIPSKTLFAYFSVINILYVFFYPVSYAFSGIDLDYQGINSSYLLFLKIFPLIYILSWSLGSVLNSSLKLTEYTVLENLTATNALAHGFIICMIIILIFFSGGLDLSSFFNRANRERGVFTTQYWVIFVFYVQTYFFVHIYYWANLTKSDRFVVVLTFCLFSLLEIAGIGARRSTTSIIIFYLYSSGILAWMTGRVLGIVCLFSIISLGLLFGALREIVFHGLTNGFSSSQIAISAINNNEFTEIGKGIEKSLVFYDGLSNLKFGETFFNIFYYFIPRFIFEDKPNSLSNSSDIIISIYAEQIINFHLLSLFVSFFLFLFVYLYAKRYSSSFHAAVFCAYTLDSVRSDLAAVLYTFVFVFIFYKMMTKINHRFN